MLSQLNTGTVGHLSQLDTVTLGHGSHTLVDKKHEQNLHARPSSVHLFVRVFCPCRFLSVFKMGPTFFQIFAPSSIKTVDYYKVLLLMFIGYLIFRQIKETIWVKV